MTVGIGVFKKKMHTCDNTCILFIEPQLYEKKGVRLYSFSGYNTNYIYTCNSLCTKKITSLKKNKPPFTPFVEIFHKTVVSQFSV